MAASAAKLAIAAHIPKTSPAERSPCSNVRNAWVRERRDIQPKVPDWPASAKSITHDPIVKPSVTMAAVAELSEIAAAKARWLQSKVHREGGQKAGLTFLMD
jgi:hypothetical protein